MVEACSRWACFVGALYDEVGVVPGGIDFAVQQIERGFGFVAMPFGPRRFACYDGLEPPESRLDVFDPQPNQHAEE